LQCHMMTRVMNDEIQQALAWFRVLHNEGEFFRVFKPLVQLYDVRASGFLPHQQQQRHFCNQRFGMPRLEKSSRQKVSWVQI